MKELKKLTDTINECLEDLKKKEIARIVITTQNFDIYSMAEPDKNKSKYYAEESLPEKEIKAANQNKSYQVISLVTGYEIEDPIVNTYFDGVLKVANTGIEINTRIKTTAKNNSFHNDISFLTTEKDIESAAQYLINQNINSKKFLELYQQGLAEENTLLRDVYKSGAMESRELLECSRFIGAENDLFEMREEIKYQNLSEEEKKIFDLNKAQKMDDLKPLFDELDEELFPKVTQK